MLKVGDIVEIIVWNVVGPVTGINTPLDLITINSNGLNYTTHVNGVKLISAMSTSTPPGAVQPAPQAQAARPHDFQKGDRVMIVKSDSRYKGRVGTVDLIQGDKVRVKIDGTGAVNGYHFGHLVKVPNDKNERTAQTLGCTHQWATYTGLFETFEYCTICDSKKPKAQD